MYSTRSLIEIATQYHDAGYCVIPIHVDGSKAPAIDTWREYQNRRPSSEELTSWYGSDRVAGFGILQGRIAGREEGEAGVVVDIDDEILIEPFKKAVQSVAPGLIEKTAWVKSPNGCHFFCRYEVGDQPPIPNVKLAMGVVDGKPKTLIETRGEGGYVIAPGSPPKCHPSGREYCIEPDGADLFDLPQLSRDEINVLLDIARTFDEMPTEEPSRFTASNGSGLRPGDDFNERGTWEPILEPHGWTRVGQSGERKLWRRPGKDTPGISATTGSLSKAGNDLFVVFSSNAHPFDSCGPGGKAGASYTKFAAYTLLNHGGDFAAATRALADQGYGNTAKSDVDLSFIIGGNYKTDPVREDPGPTPPEMLRAPGFIAEFADHILRTAPYPNPVLTYGAAIGMQSFLAARKVRDQGGVRSNLFLLGLALSAAGKDWPRKQCAQLLDSVGLIHCLGDRIASGEGVEDSLQVTPAMFYLSDEFDGLLQSVGKSRDARFEAIMTLLLKLYSDSSGIYAMRRRAGGESRGVIRQPSLTLFGTAIPENYYSAMSAKMLTNGFFSRMLILECGRRGSGQEPQIEPIPERLIETAAYWKDLQPGSGNLSDFNPEPSVVPRTDEAEKALQEVRLAADHEYELAESRNDAVAATCWGRANEQARKLALIHACSADARNPLITIDSARWAWTIVEHQIKRMLFQAASHVAETPFHAECLRLTRKLREAPGCELSHSQLLKRMKLDARTFGELVTTLQQQGDVEIVEEKTPGRAKRSYRLVS